MTLYSSRGNKLEFRSSPCYARLRTVGPFVELDARRKQPRPEDDVDRFVLDQGFLQLGFDQSSAALLRFREMKIHGGFDFRGKPFSEAEIKRGRELGERLHLSDAEERALAGSIPSLLSYINILQHVSGLEDIASKVVARPSLWSIVRHGGISAGIWFKSEQTRKASKPSRFSAGSQYYVPMQLTLNGQPALDFTLIAEAPRPPLLLCGGVVGMVAEKPGDKETSLTLHVVSAKRGPAP
jgi:hypothetical protein